MTGPGPGDWATAVQNIRLSPASSPFRRGWNVFSSYLFLAAAALSLCLLFLNQFPTCVGVSPVAWASSRFLLGFGYGSEVGEMLELTPSDTITM